LNKLIKLKDIEARFFNQIKRDNRVNAVDKNAANAPLIAKKFMAIFLFLINDEDL